MTLIIDISKLSDEEIDLFADIAVEFKSKTIEETLSRCVNFAHTCIERAHSGEEKEKIQKLLE